MSTTPAEAHGELVDDDARRHREKRGDGGDDGDVPPRVGGLVRLAEDEEGNEPAAEAEFRWALDGSVLDHWWLPPDSAVIPTLFGSVTRQKI